MFTQYVNREDKLVNQSEKAFNMIDNYIYLYHTNTLIALPLYPESISDSMSTNYAENSLMSRSAPIFSYSNSGPRTLQIELPLHRDMMNSVNTDMSTLDIAELGDEDYVDIMIKQLQSAAVPSYAASEKMVNPPMVAIRFGNSIFCKGVVKGGVTATHSGPILSYGDNDFYGKYAVVTVSFSVSEVDPYDANTIMLEGGFRGLRTTLDNNVFVGAGVANRTNTSYGSSVSSFSSGRAPTAIALS